MIYTIQFSELSLQLDMKQFEYIMKNATRLSYVQKFQSDKNVCADISLVKKGIGIEYHNLKKKKIKLLINPGTLLKNNHSNKPWSLSDKNISKIIKNLETHIDEYFNYEIGINDFTLTRFIVTADITFTDKDAIGNYIKVFHGIGKVKGYSPVKKDGMKNKIERKHAFILLGNSNGIGFFVYSKKAKMNYLNNESVWDDLRLKQDKSVLRFDSILTSQDVIRSFTDKTITIDRIRSLSFKSTEIFAKCILRIIPYGEFYKMNEASRIVEEKVKNGTMRRKMLRLLSLIPTKKSLLLAQKALGARDIDDIMVEFQDINLSPVCISRRQDVDCLENIYNFLIND